MKDIGPISEKLDFHIRISLSVSQEMGLFFAKFEDALPLYATLNEDSAEISLFLDEEQRKKFVPAFGKFTQTSRGKYDILSLKAEELVFEFKIFRDIMKLPSVIPGGFYLKEGWVYADFRFHHSALKSMSEVIRSIVEAKNRIHLSRLSPSMGLEYTLKEISSRIPITKISFSHSMGPGYLPKDLVEAKPIVEGKLFSSGMESDYDVVLYSSVPSPVSIPVDEGDGIHEAKFTTEYMKTLMKEIRRERLPIASHIGKYGETDITSHFFVPSFIADQFLEVVFKVANSTGLKDLDITEFQEITPDNFD